MDTAFKLLGRNHQVAVEAFDDPKVQGVTCFISMARKGGLTGTLGIAEETSDASIACRQVGPIAFVEAIEDDEEGEEVFKKRQSIFSNGSLLSGFSTLSATRWSISPIATS